MHAVTLLPVATRRPAQPRVQASQYRPNDFERRRIERELKDRKRYRYVTPSVVPMPDGYRIESPCCSRNIDPDGGVIDVAMLRYVPERSVWNLFRKNHETGSWSLHSSHSSLSGLLEHLKADPEREFWQ